MQKRHLITLLSAPLLLLGLLSWNLQKLSARPPAQSADTAQYRVTFTSTWSAETHPTNFPSANPHFSGLIGGTHNDSITFWEPGAIATDGIEEMAETGGTGDLRSEVEAAIDDGTAEHVLAGGGLGDSPDSTTYEFTINKEYPLVTLVSMIAPSPDWFVGVHGQSLLNNQGDWVDAVEIILDPYDAGTDSSPSYLHSENDTNPREPIHNLRGTSPFSNAPIGIFVFERLDGPADPTSTPTVAPPTESPTPSPEPTTPTTDPTTLPRIEIIAPQDGVTIQQPFSLVVEIANWELMNGGKHYHWNVDNNDQGPVFNDAPVTISGLPAGLHRIEVALAEPNHDFIGVSDAITITLLAEPISMQEPTETPTDEPTAQPTPSPTSTPMTTIVPTETQRSLARYQITFNSTWSNETHPTDNFPSNAHYSPLIGATHNDNVSLWAPGDTASPGIEDMAETGGTSNLRAVIQAHRAVGDAGEIISGGGLGTTPGMIATDEFTATTDHPLVTLVTMIAPSPDWFIGVHGYDLMDENGEWKTEVVVELYPYDAGTDDGVDYGSANADSVPKQPISALTGQTPFSTEALGSFTIMLLEITPEVALTEWVYLPVTQ